MTARERLHQVYQRCMDDAEDERGTVALLAALNAVMLADVLQNGTDEDCQARCDLLSKEVPEIFPS